MKKCAIFVEGATELEFTVALIRAIAGNKDCHIDIGRQFAGKVRIEISVPQTSVDFYFQIVDCAQDGQVKTQIKERYPLLVSSGFSQIIGLRDVYPFSISDIPALEAMLLTGLPSTPIQPEIHLAVMETEAWFLQEVTHFERIHPSLTIPFIEQNGFPISTENADNWPNPAQVLDNIYRLASACYISRGRKNRRRILRTINALSFEELYAVSRNKLTALDAFIASIENTFYSSA
jgi:hypothetical protein